MPLSAQSSMTFTSALGVTEMAARPWVLFWQIPAGCAGASSPEAPMCPKPFWK
jgi:hypothetical protein